MALRALVAKKKLDQLRNELKGFEKRETDQAAKEAALNLRETEAEKAIEEIDEAAADESRQAIETEADEIDKAREALVAESESLNKEKSELEAKIAEIEAELKITKEPERSAGEKEIRAKNYKEIKNMENSIEERANLFAASHSMTIPASEARSILIGTGTLAKPTEVGGINEPQNILSSIVDMVAVEDLTGTGGYKEAYMTAWQSADLATDGTASTPSDPVFRTVAINPILIDTLTYVSKSIKKQTPLQYEEKVRKGALLALKKKAVAYIIKGNGTTEPFGVYNAVNTESSPATMTDELKLTSATIDATTLRKIVFAYGGDENVGGGAKLFLNKKDLIKFGDVRGTNEKKAVYEITPDGANPNTGIIKDGGLSVPYVICSDVTALSESTYVNADIPTMIYGDPANYKLGLFGGYEVSVSEDYKFAEGLLSVRGEAMIGGNVIVDKGFVVVTLTTAG